MKLKYISKYDNLINGKLGTERTIEDYYKMLNIYDKIITVCPDNYLDVEESNNKYVLKIKKK